MEMPVVDDEVPSSVHVVETSFLMETLNDAILDSPHVVEKNNLIKEDSISNSFENVETNHAGESIPDSPHVVETNNSIKEDSISNSLEKVETNHAEESNPDSLEPPSKKRKQNLKQVLKKRARKYLGMKGHELRPILINGALKFCQQYNLIATSAVCYCGANMHFIASKQSSNGFVWSCKKGHSNNAVTVRKGSWFESSRNTLSEILWIVYMWVHEYSYISMLHESDVSNQSLQDWCNNCRDACQPILKTKTNPIGGSDKIIEIFEAKFKNSQDSGKKRNKNASEQWIFFAIEQFSTNSIYLSVPDKKSHTLCDIFDNYFLTGTKVYSHIWNVYIDLEEDSFNYLTKEKLITFHDCNTKTDIKTFKRFQNVAEKPHPSLNYWDKNEFCEFMYRKTLFFAPDAYLAFLKDIALVYSPEGGIIRKELSAPKIEKQNCD